jgi:hypothetical protein
MKLVLLTTIALLATASTSARSAQEDADRESSTTVVFLADGKTWRAQILGLDGDVARLRVFVLDSEVEMKRKLASFTPESQFQIELVAARPTTYDAHFAMAKKAAEKKLLGPAGAQARMAVECAKDAPDGAAKIAAVHVWAADALEKMLREAIAAGDIGAARHQLKLLSTRLADQRTEQQLGAWEAAIDDLERSMQVRHQAEREAKLDAQIRQNIERRLELILVRVAAADALRQEAVAKSRQTAQSARTDERAVEAYKAAAKELLALRAQYANDEPLIESADAILEQMHDSGIAAALHAANMLCVQSDYKGAMAWVSKVIAFDPDNEEAKHLQQAIQIAAGSEWSWRWRRR